jgi:2-dehydropantoate 2-reductase
MNELAIPCKDEHSVLKVPNVLIVGSGAIGLLWYSHLYLHSQGQANTYIFQSSKRSTIPTWFNFTDLQKNTHQIPTQTFNQHPAECHSTIRHNKPLSFDVILVCVKSYQLDNAIEDIRPFITANTIVITSHNGLGALNKSSIAMLSNKNVWNLLTTHGCLKSTPQDIIHTGSGVSDLGIQFGSPSKHIIEQTTQLLNAALPNVNWCHTLLEKQWLKLAINCVINPITALFDIKNGDVVNAKFDETISQIVDEIVQVASAENISLDKGALLNTISVVAEKTANNSSSMRCDINGKRATEIAYINGYIHKLGLEHNIQTKKNTELFQRIVAIPSE